MKNWAYFITGDNPENLKGHSPESIRKIKILASVVLLPAIIWVMLGYCFGSSFLHMSFLPALVCGLVAGTVVFLVDRLIIMANSSSYWIKGARVILAIMVAVLGSIVADHVFFEEDINMMMSTIESEKANAAELAVSTKNSSRLDQLRDKSDRALRLAQLRESEFLKETDGTGGTGHRGVGEVAAEKKSAWSKADAEYQNAQRAYNDELDQVSAREIAASSMVSENFSDTALLTQVRAMFRFLRENPVAFVIWGPFTLIMFILEILPLLIKSNMDDSAYETELKYLEEMRKRRVKLMRSEFEQQFKLESAYSESDRGAMRVLSNYQVNSVAS